MNPIPPRKKAELTIPIKLWVSPATYAELTAEAQERDWSVPQVIRRRIRELARTTGQPPARLKPH